MPTFTREEKYNLESLGKFEKMTWFDDVVKLCSGKSFGELALINEEPRDATI